MRPQTTTYVLLRTPAQNRVYRMDRLYTCHVCPTRPKVAQADLDRHLKEAKHSRRDYSSRIEEIALDPRLDLRSHSPTGFDWGYAGSGPAQTALAILADFIQDDTHALKYHQALKDSLIATMGHAGGTITGREILRALSLSPEEVSPVLKWSWSVPAGARGKRTAQTGTVAGRNRTEAEAALREVLGMQRLPHGTILEAANGQTQH